MNTIFGYQLTVIHSVLYKPEHCAHVLMDRVAHAIPMDMAQALFGHGLGVALISMQHQGSHTRPFAIHWFIESYDML